MPRRAEFRLENLVKTTTEKKKRIFVKHSSYSSNTLVKFFLVRILAALAGFLLALNSLNRFDLGLDSNFFGHF